MSSDADFFEEILDTETISTKIVTSHLRILTSSLRVVVSGFTIVTSYLRATYGQNQPVDNREKIFDMPKICVSFHGSLRVSASCAELFTDTSELLTDACE